MIQLRDRLRHAWHRLATRRVLLRLAPVQRLISVSLSTAFADALTPAQIQALAQETLRQAAMNRMANDDLTRGARCHAVHHDRPVRALAQSGKGALICSLHLGPFHHVLTETARVHPDVLVFSSDHLKKHFQPAWDGIARDRKFSLEVIGSSESTGLLRAMRGLKRGAFGVLFVDSSNRASSQANRAEHDVDLEFMGLPFRMSASPAYLAARAQVPLVYARVRREGWRREITFSDPIDVADTNPETLAAATRAMYAWLEVGVREEPAAWDGWVQHLLFWSRTGESPRVTREAWETLSRELAERLAGEGQGRLTVEPAHVTWLGEGEKRVVFHGPRRRLLKASASTIALLEAGERGMSLRSLRESSGLDTEALGRELARLVLADLATIED